METVVALYRAAADVETVGAALRRAGVDDGMIAVVGPSAPAWPSLPAADIDPASPIPPGAGTAGTAGWLADGQGDLAGALAGVGFGIRDAEAFAEAVACGATLVAVRAEPGEASDRVQAIMDATASLPLGEPGGVCEKAMTSDPVLIGVQPVPYM